MFRFLPAAVGCSGYYGHGSDRDSCNELLTVAAVAAGAAAAVVLEAVAGSNVSPPSFVAGMLVVTVDAKIFLINHAYILWPPTSLSHPRSIFTTLCALALQRNRKRGYRCQGC